MKGRSRAARLLLAALAGTAPLLLAGTAAGAAALAATSPTTSPPPPTSPPTTAAPAPQTVSAATLPCAAPSSGAPCTVDPSQLQVDIDPTSDESAVELSWDPGAGRPSSAPSPAQQSVILPLSKTSEVTCSNPAPAPAGTTATCWAWPAGMRYVAGGTSWTLNGTYQVTPCAAATQSNACPPSARYTYTRIGVAVAPAAPANLTATTQSGMVTLRWSPGPEPDLVGYTVTRDYQAIYTCSTDGAGPGAKTPCATPPSFSESPGNNTWSYRVEALRFGADASAAHTLQSGPTAVSATVSPASATPQSGGTNPGSVGLFLPPVPVVGPSRLVFPVIGARSGSPAPSLSPGAEGEDGVAGVAGATPDSPNLPYGDNPAVGSPSASGIEVREAASARNTLDSLAEIAIAVLALSLAVHVWYIRDELRRAASRLAARRAAEQVGVPSQ